MRQGGGRVSLPGLSLREALSPMDQEDEVTSKELVPTGNPPWVDVWK